MPVMVGSAVIVGMADGAGLTDGTEVHPGWNPVTTTSSIAVSPVKSAPVIATNRNIDTEALLMSTDANIHAALFACCPLRVHAVAHPSPPIDVVVRDVSKDICPFPTPYMEYQKDTLEMPGIASVASSTKGPLKG